MVYYMNHGGLQADLKGWSGGEAPPVRTKIQTSFWLSKLCLGRALIDFESHAHMVEMFTYIYTTEVFRAGALGSKASTDGGTPPLVGFWGPLGILW